MSKYSFIKIEDGRELNYVYRLGFVYRDKDGKLQRKNKRVIKEYYEDRYSNDGRFSDQQIHNMIEKADIHCDEYIEKHKNDIPVKIELSKKKEYKGLSKKEYIEYLINKGYSDEDAEEKANAEYGEDDN